MPDAKQRYDFPVRGFLTKAERWMYPGGRPNGLARLLNRGWAIVHGTGLLPRRFVTLEVPGRRTGRLLSFPLVVADYQGERYLVAMLGERSSWLRNVRAAGGRAVLRHGRREAVRLEEVDPDARAPIVRRYLSLAPGPRAFIPVDRDAPLEAFQKVAPQVPVFHVRSDREAPGMTTDPMSLEEHRMSHPPVSPETLSIRRQLRAAVNGRVVTAGDAGYDQARALFYGGFDRRPRAIVWPTDTTEVAEVVSLAAERGLELAVRGGGHSSAGHSVCDGGIVLDLSELKALEIDTAQRTGWAQTGLTSGELTTEAARHGLAIGLGDTASVGIGGLTLGGGVGYLSRKHGLTIDSLLAAELVTADGRTVRTDADTHPELFWAIRGGGGNFGVATRLHFQLHDLNGVVGGMLLLPATVETVAGFMAAAEAAPEELSAIAHVLPAPPLPFIPEQARGRMVVMALICFAGDPEAGERALAPFRALATPLADQVRPIGYPEMYPPEEEGFHPTAVGHTMFLDRLDTQAATTILEHLQASDAALRAAELRVLGGAIARVPDDATAYAHRQRRIMVNLAACYQGPDDRAGRQQWVEQFATALSPVDDGAYVNFLGDDGPARIRQAYPGPTWERLVAVKRRWDPTNLFRHNHNIPPGGYGA